MTRARIRELQQSSFFSSSGFARPSPSVHVDDDVDDDDDDDDIALTTDLSIAKGRWQNPRSRWARRRHRKRMAKEEEDARSSTNSDSSDNNVNNLLDWETFEFGTSPKMDIRFENTNNNDNDPSTNPSNVTGLPNNVLNTISTNSITYKSYEEFEMNIDKHTSTKSIQSQIDLLSLSPDIVSRAITTLSPYIQPRRLDRIDAVLQHRTRHTTFLFENPSNPSNVYACLRTLDSFGIQYVNVVITSTSYTGKAAMNQKRGMRTAMGSASWMTIRQFNSIENAISTLRTEEGCLIYASDLNPKAKDVRELIWDVDCDNNDDDNIDGVQQQQQKKSKQQQRPICIVMGNEECGISETLRTLADETFYLPMCGFAESYNLSVATAITLAYMKAASTTSTLSLDSDKTSIGSDDDGSSNILHYRGPLRPGDLDPHEIQCLKLRGVLNSLAQKRLGKILLEKEGIVLPTSLYKD
jgi:tRNA (guanosine-2'-O-)-methyltransferase